MRLIALSCLLLPWAALSEPLIFDSGEKRVTLLELYTSEGCSSCPPAEQWLSRYTTDPALWTEVVPVVFHVDYWDYIGWQDPYGSRASTRRQRRHQREGQVRSVYTPGFIANGREFRGYFSGQPLKADTRDGSRLVARVESEPDHPTQVTVSYTSDAPWDLNVAVLGFDLATEVRAGENRGRTLKHQFTVLDHQRTRVHHREARIEFDPAAIRQQAPVLPGRLGLAVWVTPKGSLKPLQATGGWLD